MGEGYIPLAYLWAHEAAPEADLYINDYNLESDPQKRAGFLDVVNKLLEDDIPIDGVGTQMHISINTSHEGIDRAFQELASTGLKVKVTELDVKINPENKADFSPSDQILARQQAMYNYVAWSYIQNVPEDQQAGISVWNLKDDSSWIVTVQDRNDYPTLFDSAYAKKPAYFGFMKGLKGEKLNN
jgi:endo-1,4-beta-xylanase